MNNACMHILTYVYMNVHTYTSNIHTYVRRYIHTFNALLCTNCTPTYSCIHILIGYSQVHSCGKILF